MTLHHHSAPGNVPRLNMDRALNHARDLRAQAVHRLLVQAGRSVRPLFATRAEWPERDRKTVAIATALLVLAIAGVSAMALAASARSQERTAGLEGDQREAVESSRAEPGSEQAERTARMKRSFEQEDRAALAEYGVDIAAIESAENIDLLWRVLRELVLPGRLGIEAQQRILRRVWAIDVALSNSAWPPSEHH